MDNLNPDWTLFRSFLAVIRTGSLSGAASTLKLTQPTLGRHIDSLEKAMGIPLFTRSRLGLAPTSAALALVPHVEAMDSAVAALARTASGEAEEARGTVRLTSSEIMGAEVLPPLLARFRARHPDIEIELDLDDQQQDLLRRDADIALRMARPVQSALIAKKIGMTHVKLFAHESYLATQGTPESIDELFDHTVIGYDKNLRVFELLRAQGLEVPLHTFSLRSDSELAQLALLRAGAGIGGAQLGVARRDRSLQPVLHGHVGFSMEMWLAMHEDLRTSLRVRLLFDHLVQELSAYARENKP